MPGGRGVEDYAALLRTARLELRKSALRPAPLAHRSSDCTLAKRPAVGRWQKPQYFYVRPISRFASLSASGKA